MNVQRWVACLDLFEEHLDRQRSALVEGRAADITAFRPPEQLGGLPEVLRPRAEQLAASAQQLETALASALAGAGRQVRLLGALAVQDYEDRGASYVDHMG